MKKIFLVDDDEDDQFLFKEALELIDPALQCETAYNGKIALEMLKANASHPDLIFLDLNMPIMNGFDLLIHIKKDISLSKIPIGVFSTSNNLRDKELTKDSGALFFITKPSDFQELVKKLREVLFTDFSDQACFIVT